MTGSPALVDPATSRSGAGGRAVAHFRAWVSWLDSRHPAVPAGLALAISAVAGVTTAVVMPRGPITPGQVIFAITVGALTGFAAGFLSGSRWWILLSPAAFVLACELARLGVTGPTVDLPDLSTTFGVLVLLLGRGFQGVLQLLPMMLGVAVGAGLRRRLTHGDPPPARGRQRAAVWTRRGVVIVLSLLVLAGGRLLTIPGSTAPITDPDGTVAEGSIAELAKVPLGGHDQTVLIRGRSTANPVLLYLAGGPGQSDLGYARSYMAGLENDFVLAVWDQRGAGTSYAELDPTGTWTLDRAVDDTVALAGYLADRFGAQKIYVVGSSWGTTLGVLAVQQRPDLFHAYIGTGQMVSQLASDRLIYDQVVAYAAATGDTDLAARMLEFGRPPYRDMYAYAFLIDYYDAIGPYPKTDYFLTHRPAGIDGTGAQEYGPLDKINKEKAIIDMAAVMYPQLQEIDFRQQVRSLQVPVYLVQGAHELTARSEPAREWFDLLQAPSKQWITFADSGHIPQFEEFERFRDTLATIVGATG